jgi:hypothetical protein
MVDGQLQNLTWRYYYIPAGTPGFQGNVVYFVLDKPIYSGEVGVNIGAVINDLVDVLNGVGLNGWNKSSLNGFFVEDIELGSEFLGDLSHTASYSWTISSYRLSFNNPSNLGATSGSSVVPQQTDSPLTSHTITPSEPTAPLPPTAPVGPNPP